jgi:PAS domain S-box-containing protein
MSRAWTRRHAVNDRQHFVSLSVSSSPSITRLLARGNDPARVVAALHQAALDLTGASASVLLCPEPATGHWCAVSAAGLDILPLGPWMATAEAAAAAGRALSNDRPLMLDSLNSDLPDLAQRLHAPACLLLPLMGAHQPVGLLLLALPPGHVPDVDHAAMIGDAMVIALDRARTGDELALHREVRELMDAFARAGASPLTLMPALEAMCRGVGRLMAADVVEVWQHDRRARALVLGASSDPCRRAAEMPIPTADLDAPLAASLRRDRAELVTGHDRATLGTNVGLVVPLRGRRRALGVLDVRGVRLEHGGEMALLDRATEIGRQLSALLENVQLLDDVMRSRAELENVFNSLADLVVVADASGRIVEVNRAFAERVAQSREALVDRPLDDVLSPALSQWIALERGLTTSRAVTHSQWADARLGGTFDLTLTPLAGLDLTPSGLVLVARDVTRASQLEAERASLERRLGQSEKLLALGQFVAGVAHELNNPLQGVLGHLELLRTSASLSPSLRRDLTLVYREAERAARVVRNLLVFAGSGRLTRRPLTVNAIVARVLQLRSAAHRAAHVEVRRHFADGLPKVKGDALLLEQAVLNLVINAEQAMAGRGELTLTTTRTDAGQVCIAVEDRGPGLSPEVRARLFEPFFTTKDVGAGTGLGLAITYGIVNAHGGTIEATNRDDGGARFVISLEPAVRSPKGGA